jgi:hypothetical protein
VFHPCLSPPNPKSKTCGEQRRTIENPKLFNHASASSVTAGIAGASLPVRRMVKAKQAATKPRQPPTTKAN